MALCTSAVLSFARLWYSLNLFVKHQSASKLETKHNQGCVFGTSVVGSFEDDQVESSDLE